MALQTDAVGAISVYIGTGDFLRKDSRLQLGDLLDQGIPVTLAYGDRDFRANCSFLPSLHNLSRLPLFSFSFPSLFRQGGRKWTNECLGELFRVRRRGA